MPNFVVLVHMEANKGLAVFNRNQLDDDLPRHRLREGCGLQSG